MRMMEKKRNERNSFNCNISSTYLFICGKVFVSFFLFCHDARLGLNLFLFFFRSFVCCLVDRSNNKCHTHLIAFMHSFASSHFTAQIRSHFLYNFEFLKEIAYKEMWFIECKLFLCFFFFFVLMWRDDGGGIVYLNFIHQSTINEFLSAD